MIGSDFELFMQTRDDGAFVPEFFLNLPDKGAEHIKLVGEDGAPAGAIHRDNVSVEVCTEVATPDRFAENVAATLAAAQAWLQQQADDLVLGSRTTVKLDRADLNHPNARELGCDVDFVVEGAASVPRKPLNAGLLGDLRHAGGHVHVSYDSGRFPAWIGAQLCDLFIGLPERHYLDDLRAQWYGMLSLHRPTSYPNGDVGVEYRSLDSGWVHTPERRNSVATGCGIVQDVLDRGDNDLIMQLMRVHGELRNYPLLLSELAGHDLDHVYAAALELAAPVSEWVA